MAKSNGNLPYHPDNLKLVPYAGWRVIMLAWAGKLLGLQFHIRGVPFGSSARPTRKWVPLRGFEG
mgnify:CR=1 FL=1